MSFESTFRRSLKNKSIAQLEAMILDLCEQCLDAEVSRQAAPRLRSKRNICINERRKRRIAQRDMITPARIAA